MQSDRQDKQQYHYVHLYITIIKSSGFIYQENYRKRKLDVQFEHLSPMRCSLNQQLIKLIGLEIKQSRIDQELGEMIHSWYHLIPPL